MRDQILPAVAVQHVNGGRIVQLPAGIDDQVPRNQVVPDHRVAFFVVWIPNEARVDRQAAVTRVADEVVRDARALGVIDRHAVVGAKLKPDPIQHVVFDHHVHWDIRRIGIPLVPLEAQVPDRDAGGARLPYQISPHNNGLGAFSYSHAAASELR